jgi:hypothetical protein
MTAGAKEKAKKKAAAVPTKKRAASKRGAVTTKSRLTRARNAMPLFVKTALAARGLTRQYEARPDYQRNDYLGWITRAKLDATKAKRLAQMLDELEAGDVYMRMRWRPLRARSVNGVQR